MKELCLLSPPFACLKLQPTCSQDCARVVRGLFAYLSRICDPVAHAWFQMATTSS